MGQWVRNPNLDTEFFRQWTVLRTDYGETQHPEMIRWCEQVAQGDFAHRFNWFMFRDSRDAAMFRLTWNATLDN